MQEYIYCPPFSSRALMNEAIKRGFKVEIFSSSPENNRAVMRATKGDKVFTFSGSNVQVNSAIGVIIASDKYLTYKILKDAKIDMPETLCLTEPAGKSRALELLKNGETLVVKPAALSKGKCVTIDIKTEEQLDAAINYVQNFGVKDCIAQTQLDGEECRFLVLDNECIAVTNRRPPVVIGDGESTIRQLIEQENQKRTADEKLLPINIENVEAKNPSGFLDKIPAADENIQLFKISNLSQGGESVNITDTISPKIKAMAVAAANACKLTLAGVDMIIKDNSAKIIEVNAGPGLRMHMLPNRGEPIDVAAKIIDFLA